MAFTVPPLPFAMDALEPYMSSKTLSYHYGKHNKAYNDTLNNLIKGTDYETMPLEEIIRTTQSGPIFNNAAQCFNHTFFWNSLKPNGGGQPTDVIAAQINAKWGSYDAFADAFTRCAVGNFGSGWTWLVEKEDGTLDIVNTSNAGHTDHRNGCSADHLRRLGTCILFGLLQYARHLCSDVPAAPCELGFRCKEL